MATQTLIMEGNFKEFSLAEVLEVTSLSRQLMKIVLQLSGRVEGIILVKSGQVLGVERGAVNTGFHALQSLFMTKLDQFQVFRMKSKEKLSAPIGSLNDLLSKLSKTPSEEAHTAVITPPGGISVPSDEALKAAPVLEVNTWDSPQDVATSMTVLLEQIRSVQIALKSVHRRVEETSRGLGSQREQLSDLQQRKHLDLDTLEVKLESIKNAVNGGGQQEVLLETIKSLSNNSPRSLGSSPAFWGLMMLQVLNLLGLVFVLAMMFASR